MTIREVKRILKLTQPKSATALGKLFDLEHLGTGLYRAAYRIEGTNLVIKVPHRSTDVTRKEQIKHSQVEWDWWKKLHKKDWMPFRPYLPDMYFHDPASGIILMKYYEDVVGLSGRHFWKHMSHLEKMFQWLCELNNEPENGERTMDLGPGNVSKRKDGSYVIHDLGYLS